MMKRPRIRPAILALIVLSLTALFTRMHPFDDDEFQHAHYAWLLNHGYRPFLDFFEHHLPTYHLLISPVFSAFDTPAALFVIRFASWACLAATLVFVFRTSHRLTGGPSGPAAAVILMAAAPIFLTKMTEARPEPAAVLCLTAALHRLLSTGTAQDKSRTWPHLALAGFLAGAVPALSHKFGLMATALVAGAFLLHGARRGLIVTAAAALPLLILLTWSTAHGLTGALYQHVFAMAVEWRNRFSPVAYMTALWSESALLVTAGLAGLTFLATERPEHRRTAIVLFLLVAAGTATLFLVPEPYRQSFLPLFPPLAMGAAVMADVAFRLISRPSLPRAAGAAQAAPFLPAALIALVVLTAAALYPCVIALANDLQSGPAADLRRMRAAEATGSPRFFDGRGLMFHRPHTGRYACMHQGILSMLDPVAFAEETVDALGKADFPTVILDYRVKQMPAAVNSFILNHYVPVGDDIFVPGIRVDRSRLVGRPCKVRISVSGLYRVSWRGGKMRCDGQDLSPDSVIPLTAGEHVMEGIGFIDAFTATLTQRATSGRAEAAP